MPYSIISPANSFVQFGESSVIESCTTDSFGLCLPVFADDDIAFQFVIQADSEAEASALCDLTGESVSVGIAEKCLTGLLLSFAQKPDRYRISPTQVLFNWQHGVPGFGTVIRPGQCFYIRVNLLDTYDYCSNCFARIADDCYTSVVEYGNEEDFAGFIYSNSAPIASDDEGATCEPTFITFSNQATLSIPYTTALSDKYGDLPTVRAWLYNDNGDLQNQNVVVSMDTFPATMINIDFGGPASGVVKIN